MTEEPKKKFTGRRPGIGLLLQFLTVSVLDLLRPVKRVQAPDPVLNPDKLQVWMVGHATMLINFYGTTILTDPVFGDWLPFPRRRVEAGLKISQLPPIDIILQSHVHMDHFHVSSMKRLANTNTTLVIAKNCADLAADMGFKEVIELEAGDTLERAGVQFTTYQPHHWGQRVPWEKMLRGYNAYTLDKDGKTVFFCGDSGYGRVFKEVGNRHEVDLALLPIGAYNPPTFRKVHMNPEDALEAMEELGATEMIPYHYGSFRLSREPFNEPEKWLRTLVQDQSIDGVHILQNGDSYTRAQ